MNDNIAILTIASSLCVFLWHFIRAKEWKEYSVSAILPAIKFGVFLMLPFLTMFGLAKLGGFNASDNVGFFAMGVLMPSVLGKLVKNSWQRSLLLLAFCVGGYYALPENPIGQIEALMAGILVWKCATNLLTGKDSQLIDVMPSFVWLCGLHWSTISVSSMPQMQQTALVLGTISIATVIRWLQAPLLREDKFYLKRIALSTIGGLALLLITSKIILVGHLDKMAIVAGVGFLGAYIFESLDKNKQEPLNAAKPLMQLLLIGIFTVAATRLFGTVGTVLLSATMLIVSSSRTANLAALFWGGRALVQGYVMQFDPNVTGINLNHAYTAAALFAGFLLMVMLAIWIRDIQDKKSLTLAFLLVTILTPMASGFFLHPEPASSLLVAAITAGIIVALFAGCLMRADLPQVDNLMLAPAVMVIFGHLTSELLTKGDEATSQEKLVVIAAIACLLVCVSLVQKVFRFPSTATAATTTTIISNKV